MRANTITILCLSVLCFITESHSISSPSTPLPENVTKDFFAYLLSSKNNIATDGKAQVRWLSSSLRELLTATSMASKKAAEERPKEKIDFPNNGTFLASWDSPTSFELSASQQTPFLALVAILCHWGPQSEYANDERTMTFILILEDDAWRVSDIHTHAGKFVSDGLLTRDLQKLKLQ
jgi:hypothetical protein